MIVHAVELAAEARVAVIEALNILAAAVERHICHAVEGNHLIALLVLQDADAVRRLIGHVDGPVILIELDIDDIAAGTDEILLDLLIRALDGRDDRDDGSDTDDDAEHRQERAELMAKNALKCKLDIFKHALASR